MARIIFIPFHNSRYKERKKSRETNQCDKFERGSSVRPVRLVKVGHFQRVMNIAIGRNLNNPVHLTSNRSFRNLWHNRRHTLSLQKRRRSRDRPEKSLNRFPCTAKLKKLFIILYPKQPHIQTHTHDQPKALKGQKQ